MKRFAWCALIPLVAVAAVRDDYARQWPLSLQDGNAGAYRVTLGREVYRSARSPSGGDIEVVNADGVAVPSALFAAEQPLAQAPRYAGVPWFALPAGNAAQQQDIAVISQRAADGSVLKVETHVSDRGGEALPAPKAWLIDASRLREPIVALELTWTPGSALDTTCRVEGSDDLRAWRVLQPQAQLLDLVRDGQRLQQRRVPLDGSAKYLRLVQSGQGAGLALAGVRAELAPAVAALPWTWEALRGREQRERDAIWYRFELDGRFPIERADVVLPGNSASEWTLQSRDADDAPWRTRAAPWVAYQVGATAADRSPPKSLVSVIRDRQWRLASRTPAGGIPTLRLGYRPEVMVFVAQGPAPYALVAGSARASRAAAPVPQLIDALRLRHGSDWRPADASLGTPGVLAGQAAFTPATPQRDWKAWLLWSILVGGVLVVAGFAFSLLRRPASQ
jgi:hypothetical protein